MNCAWGYTWYGPYLHHNWGSWLLLLLLLVGVAWAAFYLVRRVRQKNCPNCEAEVQDTYLRCPECGHGLKSHCPHCNRIVENSWQFCPHCKESLMQNSA